MARFDSHKVEYIFDLLEQLGKLAAGCGEHEIAASIDAVMRKYDDKRELAAALNALSQESDSHQKLN